ncbi:MAG: hypothetical protein E7370_05675 [Clostridiales bacterium]|nr:hypothetical protein [Clostridiales bacterium]
MNKFAKVMLGAAAVACLGSAIAFSGCAKDPVIETYEGGYQYNSWNTNYGVKVKVTTEDGVISKVETLESDWHNVSASWDGHDATVAAIPEYLAKFEGKTLAEINAIEVTTNAAGVPNAISGEDFLFAGSTQTAGRIILAMQDAIRDNGKAYGLVHGAGYVAMGSVSYFNNVMVDANLIEVCLPTYVTVAEGAEVSADDVVVATVLDHGNEVEKTFYKTVSYGNVTLTYDVEAGDYVDANGTAFKTLMATEANAKAYYEAVVTNGVAVTLGGEKNYTVMTNAALNKCVNGYWTARVDINGDGETDANDSSWIFNRDETIKYLLANGADSLLGLAKTETESAVTGGTEWANGNLTCGATWTDLNKEGAEGYLTYAQLLKNADTAAKGN